MGNGAPARRTVQARDINCPKCDAPAGHGCIRSNGSVYYRSYALCVERIAKAARLSNGGRAPLHVVAGEVVGSQLELEL